MIEIETETEEFDLEDVKRARLDPYCLEDIILFMLENEMPENYLPDGEVVAMAAACGTYTLEGGMIRKLHERIHRLNLSRVVVVGTDTRCPTEKSRSKNDYEIDLRDETCNLRLDAVWKKGLERADRNNGRGYDYIHFNLPTLKPETYWLEMFWNAIDNLDNSGVMSVVNLDDGDIQRFEEVARLLPYSKKVNGKIQRYRSIREESYSLWSVAFITKSKEG